MGLNCRFEEVDIECKLSTELTGSLRNMKVGWFRLNCSLIAV